MKLSMIAALAKGRVIGKNNAMPWHLPADFAWFRRHTLGKPIIMGRKTFESIGHPLPKRQNIVLTKDSNWRNEGVDVVHSIDAALALVAKEKEAIIIGGASIYQAFLPLAQQLYLTLIDAQIDGDTHFPDWSDNNNWDIHFTEHHYADEQNAHSMEFVILCKTPTQCST